MRNDYRLTNEGERSADGLLWIEPTSTSVPVGYFDIVDSDPFIAIYNLGSFDGTREPLVVGTFAKLSRRLSIDVGGSRRYRGSCALME